MSTTDGTVGTFSILETGAVGTIFRFEFLIKCTILDHPIDGARLNVIRCLNRDHADLVENNVSKNSFKICWYLVT